MRLLNQSLKGDARALGLVMAVMAVLLVPATAFARPASDPFVTDLVVSGGKCLPSAIVGEVQVWNDETNLYVTYVVTDPDWSLSCLNLSVKDILTDIPRELLGGFDTGLFEYTQNSLGADVKTYTFTVPLNGWITDDVLYLAAQACVKKLVECGDRDGECGDHHDGECGDGDDESGDRHDGKCGDRSGKSGDRDGKCGDRSGKSGDRDGKCGDRGGKRGDHHDGECGDRDDESGEHHDGECGDRDDESGDHHDGENGDHHDGECGGGQDQTCYQSAIAWGFGTRISRCKEDMYFTYTVEGYKTVHWPSEDNVTITIGFEDKPLGPVNPPMDWDYNDWVGDIQVTAQVFGNEDEGYNYMSEVNFDFFRMTRLAGATHRWRLGADAFPCNGTYELKVNGVPVEAGIYDSTIGLDLMLLNTGVATEQTATVTIVFDQLCPYVLPEFDQNTYHGESLFFDPYLVRNIRGAFPEEEIHKGDVRMLVVPIAWAWPYEGQAIWLKYPNVLPAVWLGSSWQPPVFQPYWWE